jgi:hypothetical protein
MMRRTIFFVLSILFLSWSLIEISRFAALAAEPQEPTEPDKQTSHAGTDDNWEFRVVPYIWFLSMTGNGTVKGNKASIDSSFRDIWANLNLGLMGLLQVRKGRIGGYADILYSRLSTEAGVSEGGTANSDTTLVITDVVGFYRLGAFQLGSSGTTPSVTVDPYVGFRSWSIRTSLNIRTEERPTIAVAEDEVWFDAIVGFRSIWNFTNSWNMIFKTDVGGGSSDITTQGLLTLGYRFQMFGTNANFQLGYRALYVDFSDTSGNEPPNFGLNATMHGPILGIGITF